MRGAEGEAVMRALRAATDLRRHFASALETGMRNDAPEEAVVQRKAWRATEMALEVGPGGFYTIHESSEGVLTQEHEGLNVMRVTRMG